MTGTMKSAQFYAPGDVRIENVEIPKTPDGGVLLKINAALTCGTDLKQYRRGHPFVEEAKSRLGAQFKGIPFGHECAGTVVEVGEGAKNIQVGDRIAVNYPAACGHCYYCKSGQPNLCENFTFIDGGAFAQYIAIPKAVLEQCCFKIPEGISFAAAALVEPVSCAVHGVEASNIQTGDFVVINGAGPIGLAMVRDAYLKGAYVICCDMNQRRLEVAKNLGAHAIVNVDSIDHVEAVRALTPDKRGCDVVIEATGVIDVWEKAPYMARKGGIVTLFGGVKKGADFHIDPMLLHYSQLIIQGVFASTPKTNEIAFALIRNGEIREEDFISGHYKLDDAVEALETHNLGIKNAIICNED